MNRYDAIKEYLEAKGIDTGAQAERHAAKILAQVEAIECAGLVRQAAGEGAGVSCSGDGVLNVLSQ